VLVRPPGRAPPALLDPRLGSRDPQELLRRFLAPMELAAFLKDCWARSAVAVQGPPGRLRPLLRDFMHDLDLTALLQDTPTERIHAWVRRPSLEASSSSSTSEQMPAAAAPPTPLQAAAETTVLSTLAAASATPAAGPAAAAAGAMEPAPPLESVAVDAEAALVLARAGAALYFRAPEELEDLLVPGLCNALGAAFAGRYPGDGKPRGEIETFIAGRGHVTGWHTDFQHNFTLQLRGSKTWRFKRGPVEHNIRALTPHYRSRSNYEQQMKLHLTSNPSSVDFRPPDSFFEDAEEVTLSAGSMLYHPAGIWHHVECLTDNSVSINVSLSCATWADLVGDGIRQLLWASPVLRAPAVGFAGEPARARRAAEAVLAEVRRRANTLTADDLLPPVLTEAEEPPRRVNVATSRLGAALAVRPGDRFRFSRLAVILQLAPGRSRGKDSSSSSSASGGSDGEAADYGGGGSSTAGSGSVGEVGRRRAVGAGVRRVYALHVNFGNEDVASWLRVRLTVSQPFAAAIEWLRNRHLAARRSEEAVAAAGGNPPPSTFTFSARELLAAAVPHSSGSGGSSGARAPARWTRVARLLRVLCHCGYLQKVRATGARSLSGPHRSNGGQRARDLVVRNQRHAAARRSSD